RAGRPAAAAGERAADAASAAAAALGADADAALGRLDEFQERPRFPGELGVRLDFGERELQVLPLAEEDAKRLFQRPDFFILEPRALEPHRIHAPDRVLPVDDRVGRHVAAGAAQAAHHRQLADADELIHDAIA